MKILFACIPSPQTRETPLIELDFHFTQQNTDLNWKICARFPYNFQVFPDISDHSTFPTDRISLKIPSFPSFSSDFNFSSEIYPTFPSNVFKFAPNNTDLPIQFAGVSSKLPRFLGKCCVCSKIEQVQRVILVKIA